MHDPAAEELRLPGSEDSELQKAVQEALSDRALLAGRHGQAVREVIFRLDRGALRVAEKGASGWMIHGWIQQAINL